MRLCVSEQALEDAHDSADGYISEGAWPVALRLQEQVLTTGAHKRDKVAPHALQGHVRHAWTLSPQSRASSPMRMGIL